MKTIRFENQVAVVTGAAGGIGFAIAAALAERGARVLLNDAGGDSQGQGESGTRAEAAAARLRATGGDVIADATPVGSADAARRIVSAALGAFGRLDILVNNAGIALPGLITDFSDDDVERIFRTNLLGPHALVRAAWPHMLSQGYGRILNTASNAAFGIGGTSTYATTKAGLLGLTLDGAIEGRAHGIQVNAMMPTALSRMIEQIPDPTFVAWFRANFPSALVAAGALPLLSRDSEITGRIFSIGGGRLARVAFTEARGWTDPALTPELAAAHYADAQDMAGALILEAQAESAGLYTELFPYGSDAGPGLSEDAVRGAGRRD